MIADQHPTLVDLALQALADGFSVVPPRQDGSKSPIDEWKPYQSRRPTEDEVRRWYRRDLTGIGVVCGKVSGGLEMLEFEGRAVTDGTFAAFVDTAEACGLGDVVARIDAGYSEATPSGGVHWLYRCEQIERNLKLARRPNDNGGVDVLIETRGEGGYVVTAPSHGSVHPTDKAWTLLTGGFATVATIAPDERAELHQLARSFDTMPRPSIAATVDRRRTVERDGERPGDDYNADPDAAQRTLDLLTSHGWQPVMRRGDDLHLRRPGKDKGSPSAVLHLDGGVFYVFSTSTVFESEQGYSPFGVYATLEHDGDFAAAAREIRRATRHLDVVPPPRDEPPGWLEEDEEIAREWNPPDDDTPPAQTSQGDEHETYGIDFITAAQLAREVDEAPPVGWLVRPLWPADAYGVLAAEKKAGKTWANLDLVVSVASGTPWMGAFPIERPGRVVVFLGEGGKRKMLRRLRAICDAKQVVLEDLDISLCFRAPHLTDHGHLTRIGQEVGRAPCALVVVDPLYLAARGAKSSQLYEMGEHLERIQTVVQAHGAALAIIHHWNKTGEGKGADRMSGVGPAEWGRVLGSAAVLTKHTDEKTRETSVVLDWEFTGDEIPETEIRIRRRIWADNPDDLDSPMHYQVELLEGDAATPDAIHPHLGKSQKRVLAVLEATDDWLNVQEIGDALVGDTVGIPLKKRTIQQALKQLADAGLAKPYGDNAGTAYSWSAMHQNITEGDNERF